MERRTCPACGEANFSANTGTWRCCHCGEPIPRPDFIGDKEPVTQYCPKCKEFADRLVRMEKALRAVEWKGDPEWCGKRDEEELEGR